MQAMQMQQEKTAHRPQTFADGGRVGESDLRRKVRECVSEVVQFVVGVAGGCRASRILLVTVTVRCRIPHHRAQRTDALTHPPTPALERPPRGESMWWTLDAMNIDFGANISPCFPVHSGRRNGYGPMTAWRGVQ
jgi:hypothetical protein